MKYAFPIICLCVLFSCAGNNGQTRQSEKNSDSLSALNILIRPSYNLGEIVIFSIENLGDSMVYIHQPSRLNIERKVDSIWHEVRVMDCPCGAPCAPPRYIGLEPFQIMDLNWNQKAKWCKEGVDLPGSDTSAYVEKGHYRFVIITNDSDEKDQSDDVPVYAAFEIN